MDPRRDGDGGDADTQAVEVEGVRAGDALDAVRAGHARDGRGHVVVESAVLVVSDHEQRALPLRAGAERLVDLLEQQLALGDVVRRVVVVRGGGGHVEVARLDHNVVGQFPGRGVGLEVRVVVEEVVGVLGQAHVGVEEERGEVLIVHPECQPRVGYVLHDGALRESRRELGLVVAEQSVGGRGMDEESVGLRGRRDGCEPAVEDGVLRG